MTSTKKQLDGMIECPVCTEVFTDPRLLPCVHSFCFKCIENFCTVKEPGTRVPCPVCRHKFRVSSKGLNALPRNFFIEQLKEIGKSFSVEARNFCELCISNSADSIQDNNAVVFCCVCNLRLCETCCCIHMTLEATRSHHLCSIRNQISSSSIVRYSYDPRNDAQTAPGTGAKPRSWRQVVAYGHPVAGVTLVGNQLFVLRFPSKQQLEVYDSSSFTYKGNVTVCGLSDDQDALCGLASCTRNNSLYVSDCNKNTVTKISLVGNTIEKIWLVADGPSGLSVNTACNVLVTCRDSRRIQEYKFCGTLVRQIFLQSDVSEAFHTIQLSASRFLICEWGPVYDVCLIDSLGRIVTRYRDKNRSSETQLKEPRQVAVDRHGHILVADCENNRIVELDSELTFRRVYHVSLDESLKEPWCLHADNANDRLFIGEYRAGRVLCVDGCFA